MNLQQVRQLDQDDPLAAKRDEYLLAEGTIYLNGNSLGPLNRHARERMRLVVEQQWGQDLIASWNRHGWIDLPMTTGGRLEHLLGAEPGSVVCCDSVSVNLFKVLAAALSLGGDRRQVLSTASNFPTDLYMVEGMQALLGEERCALQLVAAEDVEQALNERTGVLLLSQVDFRDATLFDIQQLTAAAHRAGALVIWDLSHSVGVLPLQMREWQVDFAVGCGYKYLNGGPGAPAFIYAAPRLQARLDNPLSGWMGHREPFAFSPEYQPEQGVARMLSGTPAILSLSCLDAALTSFADIDPVQLHRKAMQLSQLFLDLMAQHTQLNALQLCSPADPQQRGGHLAFAHPSAFGLSRALAADGVVTDFRSPDLLRVGFSPLTLRFEDIWLAVERLAEIIASDTHLKAQYQVRDKVT